MFLISVSLVSLWWMSLVYHPAGSFPVGRVWAWARSVDSAATSAVPGRRGSAPG